MFSPRALNDFFATFARGPLHNHNSLAPSELYASALPSATPPMNVDITDPVAFDAALRSILADSQTAPAALVTLVHGAAEARWSAVLDTIERRRLEHAIPAHTLYGPLLRDARACRSDAVRDLVLAAIVREASNDGLALLRQLRAAAPKALRNPFQIASLALEDSLASRDHTLLPHAASSSAADDARTASILDPFESQPTPASTGLFVTTTGEYFQPARVYFVVRDEGAVDVALSSLACVRDDPARERRVWLWSDEAGAIEFEARRDRLPPHQRMVVLAELLRPERGALLVQARCFARARGAAVLQRPPASCRRGPDETSCGQQALWSRRGRPGSYAFVAARRGASRAATTSRAARRDCLPVKDPARTHRVRPRDVSHPVGLE